MGPTFSIASLLVEDVGYDRFALPGLNAVIGDPKASLNTISLAQKKNSNSSFCPCTYCVLSCGNLPKTGILNLRLFTKKGKT